MLNNELLNILACPICKQPVTEKDDKLTCGRCKKYYPVREGIPIMLVEEAREVEHA